MVPHNKWCHLCHPPRLPYLPRLTSGPTGQCNEASAHLGAGFSALIMRQTIYGTFVTQLGLVRAQVGIRIVLLASLDLVWHSQDSTTLRHDPETESMVGPS